ncbi:hypothetical protein N9G63_02755 [Chitinophagales bacterium]|nr:hypothetical protein [Chitinophagales bacterium]
MHYQEKVDLLFEQECYLHRDLNTLLNHETYEWKQTSFEEKEALLMELHLSKETIAFYVNEYAKQLATHDEFQILAQSVRLLIMYVKDELIRVSLLKIYVDLSKKNE